jgi:hypothetical protein
LLREVIKKNEKTDKLFCSYFLKTVIFWLSEEQYKVIREISARYPINKAL